MNAEVIIKMKMENVCDEADINEDITFRDVVESVIFAEGLSSTVAQYDCEIMSIKEFVNFKWFKIGFK